MACIEKIYSVSALVGGPGCNGKCAFCAGSYLRPDAHKDNPLYWKNYEAAIKLSAKYGGWSLSLTSSGEPTVYPESVTKALEIYKKCADQGAFFPNVNLFTNGILLDSQIWCEDWLPKWRELGLTNIAVSIHSIYPERQAAVYGVHHYPHLQRLRENVEKFGIGFRGTLLLRKGEVDNGLEYRLAVSALRDMGINNLTSWPVSNPDGTRNEFTPSRWGLFTIRRWLHKNAKLCHGHAWGGGVYDWHGTMLRLTDYVTKHDPDKDFVRQLVVFQDGTVAYSWIREGALCMR